ncbi:peptidase, M23 domain protein [Leptospira santarosai str. 2000030832]|nr:peptidase, M23 domain protein [Leptospira santarosai str. 2000030832]
MATPAKQMSKDGNSVSGTYRIGDQDYTLRFKHLSDLSQVQNSNGSFKSSISKGSAVGVIASTGYSTGNHAHFQVESGSYLPTDVKKYTNDMTNGKGSTRNYSIDPIYFLNQMAGPNEMK